MRQVAATPARLARTAAPAYAKTSIQEAILWLYRLILRIAAPALAAHALWQRLTGRTGPGALSERLGIAPTPGAAVWLHGASNGELASARWLIERLLAARPELSMVVTSNSATARAMVAGWDLPGVTARLAPFDTPGAVARFRTRWRVRVLIVLENELWPERIAQMALAGPVMAVGARMSERSASGWRRRAPGLIAGTLRRLTLVSAQDAGSEARLIALGLPQERIGPRLMLKAHTAPMTAAAPFPAPAPRGRILLAASTHTGEEAAILAAFAAARDRFDLLILAPRHPRRSAEVAGLIAAAGLPFTTRSAGEAPGPDTVVYLADTMGEMAHWYAMAGTTLIGGTFCAAGGHTPYEPAAFNSALLHGPSVHNFAEVFAALDAAGGAVAIADAAALSEALRAFTPDAQAACAAAAAQVLGTPEGGEALLAAILIRLDA
ncbi:MAG: 3-deoxy-D-manno-octulosonic acid transferase [Gemmobacter sp.]|jgi:3-deoxy-D-manno-octulosonic-acid transferase|nr:3-deoxy-D-manno-octulosonic acid transferase [Gemmobacter sp.]